MLIIRNMPSASTGTVPRNTSDSSPFTRNAISRENSTISGARTAMRMII